MNSTPAANQSRASQGAVARKRDLLSVDPEGAKPYKSENVRQASLVLAHCHALLLPCPSLGLFETHARSTTVLVDELDTCSSHGFSTSIDLPQHNCVRSAK